MLKRSKKGFTLAELLIVVAIIAVLIAIAVPLFVGSLSKATEGRNNANVRTLRSMAVTYILMLDKSGTDKTKYETLYKTDGSLYKAYVATGTIDDKGNITLTDVKVDETATTADADKNKVDDNGTTVYAVIQSTDFTAVTASPASGVGG